MNIKCEHWLNFKLNIVQTFIALDISVMLIGNWHIVDCIFSQRLIEIEIWFIHKFKSLSAAIQQYNKQKICSSSQNGTICDDNRNIRKFSGRDRDQPQSICSH